MSNPTINPLDLADLLEQEGFGFDDDTGEVYTEPNGKRWLLIILASLGKLEVRHNAELELSFFMPHWHCYNSFAEYCHEFPHEQQCKCYDV